MVSFVCVGPGLTLASFGCLPHSAAGRTLCKVFGRRKRFTQTLGRPLLYAVRPSRYHPARRATGEPHWRPAPWRSSLASPPEWVLDPGSLTRRLVTRSSGDFSVHVRRQCWLRPRPSECRLLGLDRNSRALIREVELRCFGQAWVFARSVLPAATLTGRLRHLRRFGNHSLGELLFTDPSMRRYPFELALIEGPHSGVPADLFTPGHRHWARRCRFELDRKPIMVSEIFLAAFQP